MRRGFHAALIIYQEINRIIINLVVELITGITVIIRDMRVAYLIIAHNELNILNKLIELLDWSGNDIYILLDAKSDIIPEDILNTTKFSKLTIYTPEISISWGGSTMIQAELYLMKQASQLSYDYYCLLSGVDMPLKTQKHIHEMLATNNGTEYVGIHKGWLAESGEDVRYKVYHLFRDAIGKTKGKRCFLRALERLLISIQQPFVNRQRSSNMLFEAGTQWWCITNSFCQYILSKEQWIRDTFKYTRCCDEVFVQTLLVNSEYYSHIYKPEGTHYEQACRLIDFERGKPYIWRSADYDELTNSDAWFARKFSEVVDMDIVNKLYEKLIN